MDACFYKELIGFHCDTLQSFGWRRNECPHPTHIVIPADAGTQRAFGLQGVGGEMGSRFRGNDGL